MVAPPKKDMSAEERPKRTLLGWKDKSEEVGKESDSSGFRNKEKVLVTCSRRINFRLNSVFASLLVNCIHLLFTGSLIELIVVCRYRHLMLNVVSLLPHCKKDNKVESKASKGATLNELVELKGGSSCLFFEVIPFYFALEVH